MRSERAVLKKFLLLKKDKHQVERGVTEFGEEYRLEKKIYDKVYTIVPFILYLDVLEYTSIRSNHNLQWLVRASSHI